MGDLSLSIIAVTGGRTLFPPSFWISNLILSLAWQGHVRLPAEAGEGRDKIQLRFQKRIRQLADAEPNNH